MDEIGDGISSVFQIIVGALDEREIGLALQRELFAGLPVFELLGIDVEIRGGDLVVDLVDVVHELPTRDVVQLFDQTVDPARVLGLDGLQLVEELVVGLLADHLLPA